MRILIVSVMLFFVISLESSFAIGDLANQSRYRRPGESHVDFLNHAIDVAGDLLEEALSVEESPWLKSMYACMLTRMSEVQWLPPHLGKNWVRCNDKPRVLMFTRLGSNNVYVCNKLLFNFEFLGISQVMIHELVHVIGYGECPAYYIEDSVIKANGLEWEYSSVYGRTCEDFSPPIQSTSLIDPETCASDI